jgi:hypothetical protein
VYLSVGIGILINYDLYKKIFTDFVDNMACLYMGGVMALVVGFLLVTFHNTWTMDLSVIITILGWMALIKGVLILVGPKLMVSLTRAMVEKEKFLKIESAIIIILGLALAFLGFCPKSPILGG